jgi:hypothetical protein
MSGIGPTLPVHVPLPKAQVVILSKNKASASRGEAAILGSAACPPEQRMCFSIFPAMAGPLPEPANQWPLGGSAVLRGGEPKGTCRSLALAGCVKSVLPNERR